MLEIEALTKRYSETVAVNRVSLSFKAPGLFSILGPSGSGKTTLLRLIAGLETPDQGKIFIDNEEVSTPKKVKPPSARKLSLIFQDLALWPHMTLRDNIKFVISGNGLPKRQIKERVDIVLKWMHLESYDSRYPQKLSGGERQRLAIARALVSEPKYLLMDEPFTSLDPLLIEELKEIILRLKKDFDMTIIYVTHNIELALNLADRVAVMNKGAVEQVGDREEIIGRPQSDFIRRFLRLGMIGRNSQVIRKLGS